jgi:hypothetical protein
VIAEQRRIFTSRMKLRSVKFPFLFVFTAGLLAGCATHSKPPTIEPAAALPPIDQTMPRPNLGQNVRPSIFPKTPGGTNNLGLAGWDARWSNYGKYLQRLIDTVQAEWDTLLDNSNAYPPSRTQVRVTFHLNSDGNVSEIVKVDGNAGDLGTKYCVGAITDRAPYGKWTDDMVAKLGQEQELTFIFYYQ